jgi:hypothetical protein
MGASLQMGYFILIYKDDFLDSESIVSFKIHSQGNIYM